MNSTLLKSIFICCLGVFITNSILNAQVWNQTGDNYTTGKLGIGTNVPQANIHIKSAEGQYAFLRLESDLIYHNASVQFMSQNILRWEIGIGISASTAFELYDRVNGCPRFVIKDNGNFGIGTNNPNNRLQIGSNTTYSGNDLVLCNNNGALAIYNDVYDTYLYGTKDISIRPGNGIIAFYAKSDGNVGIGTPSPNNRFQIGSNTTYSGNDFVVCNDNGALAIHNSTTDTYIYGSRDISIRPGNGKMAIYANSLGNVLIGKTSQTTTGVRYKLDVAGPIRADEVVVNTSGADFVFAPTYKLRPLAEVEQYVNEHQHLPEIAPAAEMEANGVNVSEMQNKLLQKVEELTLYMIELQKQNEAQNKEIKVLKEKLNSK